MEIRSWLARDKGGLLCLYGEKPEKGIDVWMTYSHDYALLNNQEKSRFVPNGINPQWNDEKPVEVKVVITEPHEKLVSLDKVCAFFEPILKGYAGYNCGADIIKNFRKTIEK